MLVSFLWEASVYRSVIFKMSTTLRLQNVTYKPNNLPHVLNANENSLNVQQSNVYGLEFSRKHRNRR